ncbi:putative CDP-diacylglycerol-glycerol-3-phosphate 3-phosphatidyltransferase [Dioszegia hungarica]|uniref:CDP-diacylglycerol--glycerol-3-phosphate 3-phosphatidyltransferase n=1 Tax=Dioszegia hungarica TaxID=4972 RepID=A0AA38LV96_9TREE|nr:putative CDP-diacylglycerol-glycerol-3-phosphate 3-phosphatidyltransferase [Dioszegia hungarica]KAI9634951.1 putative CDP-diacylglycerol-glycerol-3-phosphate 3-phosphatidyltransferase [Dioszegia hungarica]
MSLTRAANTALEACPRATPGPSRLPAIVGAASVWRAPIRPRSRLVSRPRQARWNSTAPADGVLPVQPAAFDALSTALSASQPCFGARGDEITLYTTPEEFKRAMLEMIKRAKRRILISSLYIGASQAELIDALRTVLTANPHLRAGIILDYHRATRLSPSDTNPASTAHLLLPLAEEFGDRCEVYLYRSPNLRGVMEKIVPERYDEAWGTWHGKWYCVDDEVIISGANLASSYFTNRQDRYIHFRSHPTLLSYLFSLTRLYAHYSYHLSPNPSGALSPLHSVPLPTPKGAPASKAALLWPDRSIHPRSFHSHALATLTAFQKSWKAGNVQRLRRVDVDTWFWPVIQSGVLGLKEEEAALERVFGAVQQACQGEGTSVEVDLTSGYFGLYDKYKKMVIASPALTRVIAASPRANGFYGSKGFSRLIPEGYTLLLSRFHRALVQHHRSHDPHTRKGVLLKEWTRPDWTYHSKGLWVSPSPPASAAVSSTAPPSSAGTYPFLTFVGSSNLSTRSLKLDTELSMVLMTSSPTLRRALGNEVRNLDKHAEVVGGETWKKEERRVSWLAWLLVALGVEGML